VFALIVTGMAPAAAQVPETSSAAPASTDSRSLPRWLTAAVTLGVTADSNLDHERIAVDGYGSVFAGVINARHEGRNGTIEANYEAALHTYLHGSNWDRLSHNGRVFWEHDLPGRWRLAATGEFSLKGSSEDRELSNQYQVQPRIEYRLSSANRLRAFTTYRIKRYDEDPTRNATSPQAGIELRSRLPYGVTLTVGTRRDWNDAVNPRFSYRRWTSKAEIEAPIGGSDRLELELTSRVQRYTHRLVEVDDDEEELRRDRRWTPSITWVHVFGTLEWRGEYQFEMRRSNDPSKDYGAHLLNFRVVKRW
jgi:hypothetical protein